jgi:hypothetical protein
MVMEANADCCFVLDGCHPVTMGAGDTLEVTGKDIMRALASGVLRPIEARKHIGKMMGVRPARDASDFIMGIATEDAKAGDICSMAFTSDSVYPIRTRGEQSYYVPDASRLSAPNLDWACDLVGGA